MKTNSLKELQDAQAILNYVLSDSSNMKADIAHAIERINAAIFMETPAPKTKFNLWDCASTEENRPCMCGIFHDEGFKIASDARVLVAVKEDYEERLEHHIIGRDGRDIIGKYPKWRAVIPTGENLLAPERETAHPIDTAKVYELLRVQKADKKARGLREANAAMVKVGATYFQADVLAKVCRFMDHYGIAELTTYGQRRAAKAVAPDGSIAIVMPTNEVSRSEDKNGYQCRSGSAFELWGDETARFHRLEMA